MNDVMRLSYDNHPVTELCAVIFSVQSSAVITRSDILRYCINNYRNRGRISIRSLTGELWDVFCGFLSENDRVITAPHCILIMITAIVILGEMWKYNNKANLRDLIAATGLVILLKFDSNRRLFGPCDLTIWWMTLKIIGQLSYIKPSLVHHHDDIIKWKNFPRYWPFVRGIHRSVTRNFDVFFDLRLNKGLSKLSWGWWSETPSSSLWRHRNDLSHLGEFKQDLLSRNAQFGSKSAIFCPVWPWKKIGHLFYTTLSFVHHISHMWFKTGVTVRKRLIRIQIDNFCPMWPWNLMDDIEKQ